MRGRYPILCGQPVKLAITDRKAREGFVADITGTCPLLAGQIAPGQFTLHIDSTGTQPDQAGFRVAEKGVDVAIMALQLTARGA